MGNDLNRRDFLSSVAAGAAVMALPRWLGASESSGARPNILFCISDDQSWLHAGAYGCKIVNTPGFDRVAKEGVLFTNAYVSNPTCCPSRANVLTGQDFFRLGESAQNWGTLEAGYRVYPKILQAAGYHAGFTGKDWGPGDLRIGGRTERPAGHEYNKRLNNPRRKELEVWDHDYAANFKDFLADRQLGQPFCFWYGSTAPHRPYEKGSGLRAGKKLEDVEVPPFFKDNQEVRTDILDYALEIEWFDHHLERMIKMLEEAGELDNTIIVVTSDNGMPFPAGREQLREVGPDAPFLRCKGSLYDTGTRMPFAVRWGKQIKAGRVVDDFISFSDIAPMFLEAAGIESPPEVTGRSFLNVLCSEKAGKVDPSRNHVIFGVERFNPEDFPYPARGIRTEDYLYIRNYEPQRGFAKIARSPEELYDVSKDPWQMKNLSAESRYAATKKALSGQLQKILVEREDPRALGKGEVFDNYPPRAWNTEKHEPLWDRLK